MDEQLAMASEPDIPEEDYSEPITSSDSNINDESGTPKMYTPEKLQPTPFEYWDMNRIEGDVKDYIPIVRDQMMHHQMEQRVARDYQDLQRFNTELVRQPDYAEFERWFSGKLQAFRNTHTGVAETMEHYAE